MTERAIFEAAIEITNTVQREAFLNEACSGDAALRERLDVLLASHGKASQFLSVPAVEQIQPSGDEANSQTTMMPKSGIPTSREDDDGDSERSAGPDLGFLLPSSKPGSIGLLGHYEILQVLGRGAFGVVFKAFDEKLHRMVAIKVMNPALAATSPPRKRFLREARSSAAVRHENIVAIHAVEEQPVPYLVMEYIPGKTLQQWQDEHGPLDPVEVLKFGQQIAAGLAAAHAQGLIHRDIKPANILLDTSIEARIKITDFGLARAVDDASMTQSGLIAGTPMYMAPEQARGQTLDHRADLFSLGTVLYTMASGRPPFRASNTITVLKRVCEDTPRPISEVIPGSPKWLDEIIAKLLAKEPDDRFQTAKEVADLLARCQSELQLNGQVTCIASSRPKSSPHAPREESRTSTDANRASDIAPPTTSSARSAYFTWNVKATFAAVIGLAVIVGLIIKPWHNEPRKMAAPGRPSGTLSNAKKTAEGGHPTSPTSWHGWPADAPPPAMAPFDAEQAQHHQEAWAKYLGVPVEYTNSLGMKFRLIPPGEFLMGSTLAEIEEVLKLIAPNWEHERECLKSESPQQPVVLTQPIYFSVHEVTQKQYQVVMGVNPAAVASTSGDQTFVEKMRGIDTSDFPVENISWNDATEFSKKLNLLEKLKLSVHRLGDPSTILDGSEYRLPTEAEWEFACRSGSVGPNWLGRNSAAVLDQIGWYIDNSEARTHAAGAKKSNPFGLFDMHGNVWEWCLDLWQSREQKLLSNDRVVNPNIQTSESLQRIIRGGNWCGWGFQCGASARSKVDPNQRVGAQAGIRLTLSAEAVKDFLTRELSLVTGPAIPRSTRTGAKLSVVESLTSPDYEWTEPEDLGPVVNFAAYNYCPRVTNDGLEMWFVGNGGKGSKGEDDVWVSRRKSLNHSWEVPINAGEPINTTAKEKDFSLTGDGLSVFFRSWARDGISVSKRTGRDQPWSTLEVIPSLNGNDAAKDANNPVVSPDGLTLFVALPPEAGGPGGSNIAVVTRKTASDPWSLPTIFPEPLNSPGEDLPCWLSADGRLMLLSSKRDGGMGDSDLWMATRKTDATEWQPPVNLGKGINTEHGEFAGHLALDGQTLWFSRHVPQGQYRYQVIWQSRRVPKKRVATLPIELEDRDIAEEILRRGGIVVVNTESEELEIKQLAQLPARPMTLIGVNCETIRSSTDANLVRLLSQARHLRHVNLGSSSLTDEQTTFLENLPNLEVVILWNNPKITKTTADRMRGLTKLRGIALNSTTLGPGGLDGLRGAVLLEELRVLDCRLGDEDLEIVKNLPNLQVLEVGANPLTSRSLETFRGLRDLRHLDIHRLKITDDDLVQLTGFPKLELLDLSSTQVSDLGLRRVATITGLRVLNLSGTSITGEGLPHLKELKQLTELVIVNGVVNDAGLQQLPDLPRLHKLSLVRNPISSQSLKALDRVPNLEMLALDGTRVDDAAMEHIARLARLKTLYLARTQITDAGLMKLKSLGQLQSLNVRSTKVTKEGVTALKELCPQCRIESDHGTFEP